MKHFKTPKGTELPLLDLRGKDYLQVAHRLVWFREEHPDWSIETEFVRLDENHAVVKATILEGEHVYATAHKCEDRKGFADYIEKAETGAIGRALAHCGYGTQFAPELDEGERLADSPVNRPKQPVVQPKPGPLAKTIDSIVPRPDGKFQLTEPQVKRLWAIVKASNWTEEDLRTALDAYDVASTKDLSLTQYNNLIGHITKNAKKEKGS